MAKSKPISALKLENIKKNKVGKKAKKAELRRKQNRKARGAYIEDKPPVTYYDLKRLRDEEKVEKKRHQEEKKNQKHARSNLDIPKGFEEEQNDMLDPLQLERIIRDEDKKNAEVVEYIPGRGNDEDKDQDPVEASNREALARVAAAAVADEEEEKVEKKKEEELGDTMLLQAEQMHFRGLVRCAESDVAKQMARVETYNRLLPIRVNTGIVQHSKTKPKEFWEEDGEDDSGIENDAGAAMYADVPVGAPVSVVDVMAERRRKLKQRKILIGFHATKCMSSIDTDHLHLLELVKLVYEADVDVLVTVRRLAALSLLRVFRNIIPSYVIDTMEIGHRKLKRVTREVALEENKLLSRYKYFLKSLECMLVRAAKERYEGLHLRLACVSLHCFCELMEHHPRFNFADNILQLVIPFLSSAVPELRSIIATSIEKIFNEDEIGQRSLQLVGVINKFVRKRQFNVHETSLRVLLKLRVARATALDVAEQRKMEATAETAATHRKLGALATKNRARLSIKETKRKRKIAVLNNKMKGRRKEEAQAKESTTQTEIMHTLFGIYVHVIKYNDKRLLSAVLEGLASFGHLVNVEYFSDLLSNLERLLVGQGGGQGQQLTLTQSVHCIQTVFKLLKGLGTALPNDPSNFSDRLFALLPEIGSVDHAAKTVLPALKTLLMVFVGCKKRVGSKQVVGFIKRLATVALSLPHSQAIPVLMTIRCIMLNHSSSLALLDTSNEGGSGVYQPELPHPIHCNAAVTALWEMHLLTRQYHPMARQLARHLYKGAPLLGEACLPPSFTKQNLDDLAALYCSSELRLQPSLQHPDVRLGPDTGKWSNTTKRKIASARSFTEGMCDDDSEDDESDGKAQDEPLDKAQDEVLDEQSCEEDYEQMEQ